MESSPPPKRKILALVYYLWVLKPIIDQKENLYMVLYSEAAQGQTCLNSHQKRTDIGFEPDD